MFIIYFSLYSQKIFAEKVVLTQLQNSVLGILQLIFQNTIQKGSQGKRRMKIKFLL